VREETIDNRRRALASFDMYFENIKKGDLKDLDDTPKEVAEAIENNKEKKKRVQVQFKNEAGQDCYFIDSSGVKLDNSIDREGLSRIQKKLAALGDLSGSEEDMRDAPLFPHEPRMTDVAQEVSGECYLYSGLQDIARLYPQKIKDMIKDNGDGTCTVRFYGKTKNKETNQTEYRPVYVRVDKIVPKIGIGLLKTDRLGQDCLWVNMIERAYAMSGLHVSSGEAENLPIDLNDEKNKKWKPSISGIEGGHEYNFLETMLGPDGVPKRIDKPGLGKILEENRALEKAMDNLNIVKDIDVNSAESIARHAYYYFYKSKGGDVPESEFQKMDRTKMINLVEEKCSDGTNYEYFEDAFDVLKSTAQKVIDDTKGINRTSLQIQVKLKAAFERSMDEAFPDADAEDTPAYKAVFSIYKSCKEGIYETGMAAEVPGTPIRDEFYKKLKENIDKGLPISCATYSDSQRMDYADARHAYSLIGAYKTDDVPPKHFVRIKNPHTKLESTNGMEYTNENGEVVGKWVNVKDGIFDMQLEHFLHDYEYVYVNGSDKLEAEPHCKVQGYDIIGEDEIVANEANSMTSGKLTDVMKVSNDLYDAMISTNSKYSKDSDEYKNLLEGIKQFRHDLAGANGRTNEQMKKLTEPLLDLVAKYEKHVNDKILGPSKRQGKRMAVCSEIKKVCNAIDAGKNPQQEYEKEYAKKLIDKYYDMNGIKDKSKVEEVAGRLYNNKAFRNIANSTNITKMNKPDKNQMEQHLKTIETKLKGRGNDKPINMATMKQEPQKQGPKR